MSNIDKFNDWAEREIRKDIPPVVAALVMVVTFAVPFFLLP